MCIRSKQPGFFAVANSVATLEHTKRKLSRRRNGLFLSPAIRQHARQLDNFRDPAAVILALRFHFIYNMRHIAVLTHPWPGVRKLLNLGFLRAHLLETPRDKAQGKSSG
jgi:hypothetical protein